ncbi:hypothetical protein GS4_40_00030 [Gordonia soli NBRC 108243]|uniref:Helicase n=2 Tax=Gordonia soli TaxID=320799 RepID=M0QQ95_9ACTN|nr:hypothetical protein GS4_40_00030 [Gordonia soli NBRC 108243]
MRELEARATEAALAGKRVAWFAPTLEIAARSLDEILDHLRASQVVRIRRSTSPRVEVIGGGSIAFASTRNPDAERGRSYDVACIDRADLIDEGRKRSIRFTVMAGEVHERRVAA